MDCQNLLDSGWISSKAILIFPGNFLDFELDTIEKQAIAVRVLSDYDVAYLGEGLDATFCLFWFIAYCL